MKRSVMAFIDLHLLTQSVFYLLSCVSGLFVAITTGVNRNRFQGTCILYAEFEKKGTDHVMHGSSVTNCNFPVYFSVLGLILYGVALGVYNMYAVCKSRRIPTIGSEMWVMPFLLLNAVLTLITLVVACIVSVGFAIFCNNYLDGLPSYAKCSSGENTDWTNLSTGKKYDPGNYVTFMTVAMIGAWSGFLFQLIQVALGIARFIRNRRLRGSAAQKFVEAKERAESKTSELDQSPFSG